MSDQVLHILGEAIPYSHGQYHISELRFLKWNPRVYDYVQAASGFAEMTVEEQQRVIYEGLLREASVKELLSEIQHHRGIMEPLLVLRATMEVVEGNSRLAAYRKLNEDERGEWEYLPCIVVSNLTERQQSAYLAQVHVKGKRQWSAYEKANYAYVQHERGRTYEDIAKVFGVSPGTVRTPVRVIQMMKDNADREQSNFSYYNVIVRNPDIRKGAEEESVREMLLGKIKSFGLGDEKEFTAQELRDKLPEVLRKRKVKKKFISGAISLDEAYERARSSRTEHKVRRASGILDDISRNEVSVLERSDLNAVRYGVRKLAKIVTRLQRMIDRAHTERGRQ